MKLHEAFRRILEQSFTHKQLKSRIVSCYFCGADLLAERDAWLLSVYYKIDHRYHKEGCVCSEGSKK